MHKLQKYSLLAGCVLIVLVISFILIRRINTNPLIASLEIAEPLRIIPVFKNHFYLFADVKDDIIEIWYLT